MRSKLTIMTPERRHCRRSVDIVSSPLSEKRSPIGMSNLPLPGSDGKNLKRG